MSLMQSKQAKSYKWQKGDLITTAEAAALLGYKSPAVFQKKDRLESLKKSFESVGVNLTTEIYVNNLDGWRLLRSEIDEYLEKIIARAKR